MLIGSNCASGYALFPSRPEAKAISFESSTTCESFAQQLSAGTLTSLTFEFAAPEEPLLLVAFE